MHNSLPALIGVIAGTINTLGLVTYVRDILHHKTKPERTMWWIYSVLFALLFAAQLNAGARWLLLVTGAYVLSAVVIAVLSLRYGYGKFHKRDAFSIVVAALGLVLWLISSNPLFAIVMVIIVDFAGFWLTLIKAWHAPRSETLISWQAAFVAAVLSVFTLGNWKLDLVIYPIYAVSGTALIVWLLMYRRTKVKEDLADF